jgi:hypothetical protein
MILFAAGPGGLEAAKIKNRNIALERRNNAGTILSQGLETNGTRMNV